MGVKGMLFDVNLCGGCFKCVEACMKRQGSERDPETATRLAADARTAIVTREDFSVRRLCRHCLEPACVGACPADALRRTPLGPVAYEASRCMGCRYCMLSCPFDVPRYEWDKVAPAIQKCDMCEDRVRDGKPTACAEACPAEATVFGDRDELLKEAWSRIREDPDEYHPHVYGENEYGGSAVMMISPFPLELIGYGKHADGPSPVSLARKVLEEIPGFALTGAAALCAIWWITRRRDQVRKEAALAEESSHDRGVEQ